MRMERVELVDGPRKGFMPINIDEYGKTPDAIYLALPRPIVEASPPMICKYIRITSLHSNHAGQQYKLVEVRSGG